MPAFQWRNVRYSSPELSPAPGELEALDCFLGQAGEVMRVRAIDELHGLLTVAQLTPGDADPEQWLPLVWRQASEMHLCLFGAEEERRLMQTIFQMHDDVGCALAREDERFQPLFLLDIDPAGLDVPDASRWSRGFLIGLTALLGQWSGFLANPATSSLILPIVLLGSDHLPSPWTHTVCTPAQRAGLSELIPTTIAAILSRQSAHQLLAQEEARSLIETARQRDD